MHILTLPHFVCPRVYPFDIIWQLRVDAEFPSLPTAFPEACDAKHSPAIPVVLAQNRSSRITRARILASPGVSGAEHVVCDVVVHVHISADVAGYYRHLQIKHKLFIVEIMKCFTVVTERSPMDFRAGGTRGLPLLPPVVFFSSPL